MTQKPLDEMTPEEIRLEIAERKEWQFPHEEEYMHYVTHDMAIDAGDRSLEGQPMPEIIYVEGDGEPPNWPESIEAAWELVEELPHISISDGKRTDEERFWWCGVYLETNCIDEPDFDGYGDTAPLAICKAWLAWKRSESNV